MSGMLSVGYRTMRSQKTYGKQGENAVDGDVVVDVETRAAVPKSFEAVGMTLRVDPSESLRPSVPPVPPRDPAAGLPSLCGEDGKQLQMREVIGTGAMGVVSLATQLSLGREVAVKSLRPERASPEGAWELLREGRVLGMLEHPNVVPVHMLGVDELGFPAIVMKHVVGTPWSEFTQRELRAPDPVDDPLDWNLRVLIQVAHAAHFAHTRAIVHRDIKPQNVMIGNDGEVYLVDWGLAVALREGIAKDVLTVDDIRGVAGTPAFIAPEMVHWDGSNIDARTDVFLLGGCLHAILTGRGPNSGATVSGRLEHARESPPPVFDNTVPKELAAICTLALSRDKGARFETARDFHRALEAFLTHRQSFRIGAEAAARAQVLDTLLSGARDDRAQIHSVFGESRFGFEQAIRGWAQNLEAIEGRDRLLTAMANYWIDEGEVDSARALLEQMRTPSQKITDRFHALVAQRHNEVARLEALESLQRDVDLRAGSGGRGRIMRALGVPFALVYLVLGVLARRNVFRAEHWSFFLITCAYGLVVLATWVGGRKVFVENTVGRRFMIALGFAFLGPFMFWPAAIAGRLPFSLSVAIVELIYFLVAMMMASSTHRALFVAGSIYALGFITTLVLPQYTYEILSLVTLLALWRGALAWEELEERDKRNSRMAAIAQ